MGSEPVQSVAARYFRTPLADEQVRLLQTRPAHFDALYAIARQPELWAQHPEQDRWKREKFKTFFASGLANELGCYSIAKQRGALSDAATLIGMTRFYGFEPSERVVRIGYTFIKLEHWGTDTNRRVKSLMLDHAFKAVDRVCFDIGSSNLRSQRAIAKLGAKCVDEAAGTLVFALERADYECR